MKKSVQLETVIEILDKEHQLNGFITYMCQQKDPFKVLIACILSLRTKDETTHPAAERLFNLANTPQVMMTLTQETIEQAIYPVGFYRNKARQIIEICRILVEQYHSKVPDTIEELLKFNGVGRKTANLVVSEGYHQPAICVDTHVHRICNRLGYLTTKNPEETEMSLRKTLDKKYWKQVNHVFVLHGQNICKPIGARCDICPVYDLCLKIDVKMKKGVTIRI